MTFLDGGEIDSKFILNEYPHANLLVKFIIGDKETIAIWDVSQYEKNKIIGLTTFGPAQWLDEGILRLLKEKPDFFAGMDEEDFVDFRKDLAAAVEEQHTLITNVTVYQMKDGTWLWR